jgi:hypothetical protein
MAILFISSELPEVLRCSDRIVVMRDRKVRRVPARRAGRTVVLHLIAEETTHETERRPVRHRLFWPLAALALLLLIDLRPSTPGFFHLEIKDGHLYGSLVDIVNRAAPLMLAALGMTLVIATRGIDISVGAVVALAGTSRPADRRLAHDGVATHASCGLRLPRAGRGLLCGAWNGALVAGAGPAAHRRHADPDGGRPRPGAAADRRPDRHRLLPAVLLPRQRLPARPAVLAVHRGAVFLVTALLMRKHGAGPVHPGGRHQSRRRRGWPACRTRR